MNKFGTAIGAGLIALATATPVVASPVAPTFAPPTTSTPSIPENRQLFADKVMQLVWGMEAFAAETCRNPHVTAKAIGVTPDEAQKAWGNAQLEKLNTRLANDTEAFWSAADEDIQSLLKGHVQDQIARDRVLITGFVVPEYKEPFFDAQRCIAKARTGHEGKELVPLPVPKK